MYYRHNPLYPDSVLSVAKRFLEDPTLRDDPARFQKTLHEVKMEVALIIHESPYVEVTFQINIELSHVPDIALSLQVRAVVSSEDDPSVPCSTIRAWVIGLFFACTGAVINQLFSLRYPRIEVCCLFVMVHPPTDEF